jgi:hypothetical protein
MTLGEEVSGTHRTGGWVGPKGGLEAVQKGNTLALSARAVRRYTD